MTNLSNHHIEPPNNRGRKLTYQDMSEETRQALNVTGIKHVKKVAPALNHSHEVKIEGFPPQSTQNTEKQQTKRIADTGKHTKRKKRKPPVIVDDKLE